MQPLVKVLLCSVFSCVALLATSNVGSAGIINSHLSLDGERCTHPPVDCFTVRGLTATGPWQGRIAFTTKQRIEMSTEQELVELFQAEYIVALDVMLQREDLVHPGPHPGPHASASRTSIPGATVRGQSIGF